MQSRSALCALVLLAIFACGPASAGSWATSSYNGLGFLDEGEFDDDAFGSSFSLVWRWNETFGVEGGYTQFGDFKNGFDSIEGTAQAKAELDGFTLGLYFFNDLNADWYVTGRLGVWSWDAESSLDVPGAAIVRFDDDGTDLYLGAGFGYKFTERFGAGLGFSYYNTEVGGSDTGVYIIGLNTGFRF